MKNHGFGSLAIVAPEGLDRAAAKPLAVHAEDVLERATVVSSLSEAICESTVIAGVTRRVGQKRKPVSFSARQFAGLHALRRSGRVSVVFGNEQAGLSDDELELCTMAVFVPSSPLCPSLNLSHAVQVVAYELFVASSPNGITDPHKPLSNRELRAVVGRITDSLEEIGYHPQDGPQGMRVFLRETLGRAALMPREAQRFEKLFAIIAGIASSR
jgi:TrmH family RNA methyltransferase